MKYHWNLSLVELTISNLLPEVCDQIFMQFTHDELISLLNEWNNSRSGLGLFHCVVGDF